MEQGDAFLTRLGTDCIDLYQIPENARRGDDKGTARRGQGQHRYLGASSMYAGQFAKMQHTTELHGWTKFVSTQDQYNLVQRSDARRLMGRADRDRGQGASLKAAKRVSRPL